MSKIQDHGMNKMKDNLTNNKFHKEKDLMKIKIWKKVISKMNKWKMICKWMKILMNKIVKVQKKNSLRMYLIKQKMKIHIKVKVERKIDQANLVIRQKIQEKNQKVNSTKKEITKTRIKNREENDFLLFKSN